MSHLHTRVTAAIALLALGAACGGDKTGTVRGQINVSLRVVDFGEVPVLNTKFFAVEVQNVGRAPLNIESATLKEAGVPFKVEEPLVQLAASETQKLVLSFKPPKQEDYVATLVIASDDQNEPSIEVKLSGKGSTVAKMTADEKLDFLLVCEDTGDIKRLKVHSGGTADLIIEEIKLKEGSAPEFQFVSSTRTPSTIARDSDLLVSIKYLPTSGSPDESKGTLVITGTDPEHRTVEIPLVGKVNRAPIAQIAIPPNGAPGATVPFDGSASHDPDNHTPLQFAWTVKASPIGSKAKPLPADVPKSSLTLDLPGAYTMQLKVKDALGCYSKPVFQDILAKPAQQLLVELVWNNHDTDMDLHMIQDADAFFGPRDCFYNAANLTPDWGIQGDASDDPSLDRDDLTGFGPEIIGYKNPAKGKYRVMVHFFSDHGSKAPTTEVTVRVYEFGVVKSEQRKTLTKAGQKWTALSLEWPSGNITPVDTLE